MPSKIKFEMEYLLKTSPKVLETMLSTPSGLSEWFADDVNVKGDMYTFVWGDSEQEARFFHDKQRHRYRYQWIEDSDQENECYFELGFTVDPMTKEVIFSVVDYAEMDEVEDSKLLWEQQVADLRRTLGC
jgi:uncharacterized protein YndB with AHSA1/START domain